MIKLSLCSIIVQKGLSPHSPSRKESFVSAVDAHIPLILDLVSSPTRPHLSIQ